MPFRRWLPNVLLALLGSAILFAAVIAQAHDPEKWEPVFGSDHAPS